MPSVHPDNYHEKVSIFESLGKQKSRISVLKARDLIQEGFSHYQGNDGSVKLPAHEVQALVRNLSKKEKRISRLWWMFGLSIFIGVVAFLVTFASSYIAIKETREIHVNGATLEDSSGYVVSTSDPEAFSSIFDLPHYDTYTLSHITHLSVKLVRLSLSLSLSFFVFFTHTHTHTHAGLEHGRIL